MRGVSERIDKFFAEGTIRQQEHRRSDAGQHSLHLQKIVIHVKGVQVVLSQSDFVCKVRHNWENTERFPFFLLNIPCETIDVMAVGKIVKTDRDVMVIIFSMHTDVITRICPEIIWQLEIVGVGDVVGHP